MAQINCWEYHNCDKHKECTAYPDNGRICFRVEKTLCRGEEQGNFRQKEDMCKACNFYKTLR